MFLTSPRNSVVAHSSLFKRLNCTTLISPLPRPPTITTILEAYTPNVLDAPTVDQLVSKEYSHFNFPKTYPEAAREIPAVLYVPCRMGSARHI